MTTLTTMLGVIPMALSKGEGAEIYAPLGQAIAGGLLTSTMITLFIIPVLYFMTEKKRDIRNLKELIAETNRIYKEDNEKTRRNWLDIINDTKIEPKPKKPKTSSAKSTKIKEDAKNKKAVKKVEKVEKPVQKKTAVKKTDTKKKTTTDKNTKNTPTEGKK